MAVFNEQGPDRRAIRTTKDMEKANFQTGLSGREWEDIHDQKEHSSHLHPDEGTIDDAVIEMSTGQHERTPRTTGDNPNDIDISTMYGQQQEPDQSSLYKSGIESPDGVYKSDAGPHEEGGMNPYRSMDGHDPQEMYHP